MIQSCPHCNGYLVTVESYESGVYCQDHRCLMCGRYWPIRVVTAQVDVSMSRAGEYKPFKRIESSTIQNAKDLISQGFSMAESSRMAGISHASLRKIYHRNGWEYVQHKKSGRVKG